MQMRIKKKGELPKLSREKGNKQRQKQMSITMTSALFSHRESRQSKLPLLRPNLRQTSIKFEKQKQQKEKQQTETTAIGSEMLQSYYQTIDKGWIKPSQYLQEIKGLNLITDGLIQMENYQVKLSESMEKNMAKLDSLMNLIQKWITILRKILQYTNSKKTNTPHLQEQVKFWRLLSKKFDELQYEFNNDKVNQLVILMKHSLKSQFKSKDSFQQFVKLKDKVIETTPMLRKLYLCLEEGVSGNVQRFVESSNIVESAQFLKRILLNYEIIAENNQIARTRMEIVYDKMNDAMIQKLTVASLYPRQLANISSVKQKYATIDKALSFYYNFIAIIQSCTSSAMQQILQRAEHTRNVLVNLLQIMGYFQYLYRSKQVLEFSKLFSIQFEGNIFDYLCKEEWYRYMEKVNESMLRKKYQP